MTEKKGKWAYSAENLAVEPLKFLHQTRNIKNFLDSEGIWFVCGLKGLGKTLILKAKREKYFILPEKEKNSYIFIPNSSEFDIFSITHPPEHKWELLQGRLIWQEIWGISIGLSIISYYLKFSKKELKNELIWELNNISFINAEGRDRKVFSSILNHLLKITRRGNRNPSQFLTPIINNLTKNMIDKSFLGELYSSVLNIVRTNIQSGCVIFIDGVDKTLEDLITEEIRLNRNKEKIKKLQDIWVSAQIGLIFAVFSFCANNHHIRIYTTIRQEVIGKLEKDDTNPIRYEDMMLILNYDKNDLKNILIKGIDSFETRNLVDSEEYYKNNKIKGFLGFDFVKPMNFISGEEIRIFDYMYYYSIQRPRDIIFLGGEIASLDIEERTPEKVQQLIKIKGERNLSMDYLSHLEVLLEYNFNLAFSYITKNVLSKNEIMAICRQFHNKDDIGVCNCEKCEEYNVFLLLYNLGLLGVLKRSKFSPEYHQKFLEPEKREIFISTTKTLPNPFLDLFFLHPALSDRIKEQNENFEFLPIMIGDGCKVDIDKLKSKLNLTSSGDPTLIKTQIKKLFRENKQKHSTDDLEEAQSKSLEFLKNQIHNFKIKQESIKWLDVGCGGGRCLNVFNIFIEEDPNWNLDIDYIGIDISEQYFENAKKLGLKFQKNGLKYRFDRVEASKIYREPRYDLVTAILLLHELDPIQLPYILRNMMLSLKKDGILVIYDFLEPSEQERHIIVWDNKDIKEILMNALGAIPSCEIQKGKSFSDERKFFSCYVNKGNYDDKKFQEFISNYHNFIDQKIYKLKQKLDSLEKQCKEKIQEMLSNDNIEMTDELVEQVYNELEELYQIKLEKIDLLNEEIVFLNKVYPSQT